MNIRLHSDLIKTLWTAGAATPWTLNLTTDLCIEKEWKEGGRHGRVIKPLSQPNLWPLVGITGPRKHGGQGQINKPCLSVSSPHPLSFSHTHTVFLNMGMLRLSLFRNIWVCNSGERGKYSWQAVLSDKGKCNWNSSMICFPSAQAVYSLPTPE